ncbi:MAG: hypothetical protein ABI910_02515 [Gemmatimonadota bacterium]
MPPLPRLIRPTLAVLVLVMTACGGGDGGTTPTPIPQGFTVALSASTLSVEQGAAGSVTATIGRTGSFSGTVTLAVENVPAGMTATFSPTAITSNTTSTTLAVTAATSVAPGSYSLTIRGQAAGVSDQTGTVSVTVTAKPAIAVTLSPTAISVAAGGTSTYTTTIARTNFTGAVTVTVTGAPGGVTVAVAAAGDVHTVTVTVGASAAPGIYALTTTASATGVAAVSSDVALSVTAPAAASIALAATPAAISIQAGGASAITHIAITRTNFTGTVVIAVQSGLPVGVTITNAPAGPTLATAVDLTFSAAASVVPGTYAVVLQGAGFQATSGTVQVALTVTPPNASGQVAIALAPSSINVQPGGLVTGTLALTRTNFTGAVNLSVSGAPTGITSSVTPTTTTQSTATLTVAAGSSAVAGSYTLTVTASGTGIAAVQLSVPLTVAPIASGGNVNFRFCTGYTSIPIWFAAQDGGSSAPWTPVATGAGNSYSFNIGSLGAVAFVTQQAVNNYQLTIAYGSAAELGSRGTTYCPTQTLKSLTGTVAGFGANNADFVSVSMGTAFATPQPSFALPNFSLVGVSDAAHDLVGTRSTFNISNPSNPLIVNKVFIKRGLNPPNLSSVGTVDFEGSNAFAPGSTALTINGLTQTEQVSVSNTFITHTQSFGSLGAFPLSSGSTANILIVPPAQTVAGDVQAFAANAYIVAGSVTAELRSVTAAFQDPTNRTVTLGARMNDPTISTVATTPYARLRTVASRQSDYQDFWTANYTQLGGSPRGVSITMSSAYIGNAGSFDVTMPNFSGVGAWQNTWGLLPGVTTNWNVSMTGWISGSGGLSDGAIFRTAQRQGTLTP